jgi:hypothetical protein
VLALKNMMHLAKSADAADTGEGRGKKRKERKNSSFSSYELSRLDGSHLVEIGGVGNLPHFAFRCDRVHGRSLEGFNFCEGDKRLRGVFFITFFLEETKKAAADGDG